MSFRTLLKTVALVLLLLLFLTLGLGAGIVIDRHALLAPPPVSAAAADGAPDINLINQAWSLIDRNFVDRSALQTKPLTYGAISGMVSALGDTGHTTFMTPEMVKSERDYTRGQFEGIGAQVESKDGRVVIVAPFDNSPAQQAGLKAGDAIIKVNGEDVTGQALELVISKIVGPAGTTVNLTVLDGQTKQTRELTITRARITLNNVTWARIPGTNVGHLRIAGFSQGISQQVRQALSDMQQQGITSVVLDLRNNPGGLLEEAVNTTSQFLSSGDVLLEQDAQGQTTHVGVRPGGVATKLPIAILINNGSASASEIVAGALQDAGRGPLIGETTFGTGTVLNQFNLSDGSAMMLATQEWLTPKGRVIWHKGIEPDQKVTLPTDATSVTPEREKSMTPEQLQASGDQQLLQALQQLNQHTSAPSTSAAANVAPAVPETTAYSELALQLDAIQYYI